MTAAELREAGLTYAEIARRLGVSKTTARRQADPQYAEKARAGSRDWKHRNPGAVSAYSSARYQASKTLCDCGEKKDPAASRCKDCRDAAARDRLLKIETLWKEGASLWEIASALDSTQGSVSVTMAKMRREGFDLPYRR